MRLLLGLLVLSVAAPASTAHASTAHAQTRLALVYAGPGVCNEGCVEAAADVARRGGMRVRLVGPSDVRPEVLRDASVWIQPGGDAIEVAKTLSAEQKEFLREFVRRGSGYIGFCAGAFLADSTVDNENTVPGLGLIPGGTHDLRTDPKPVILPVVWNGRTRHLYFEGGAYFDFPPEAPVNIIARYQTGQPATIGVRFGRGRVVVTGPHPEAPVDWANAVQLEDPDGTDFDLAHEMLLMALPSRPAD